MGSAQRGQPKRRHDAHACRPAPDRSSPEALGMTALHIASTIFFIGVGALSVYAITTTLKGN
jgi:hypothetical protein